MGGRLQMSKATGVRSMRWMSAWLAGGLVLSAYACSDKADSSGADEDDGSGGVGGSDGGSGGDGGGGGTSSGAASSGGTSSGGTSNGGSTSTSTSSSTSDAGGSSSVGGNGGSAGEGGSAGSGGTQPIECTEDADCENADMVCDPLTQLCVPCLFDNDCSAGERCDGTTCVDAVDCVSSDDCQGVAGNEACDTAAGHCVECVSASDCPESADCIDQHCRAYRACTNSLDCPTPRVCDQADGHCVQCVSSPDCEEGLTCVANTCRRTCSSDNECTAIGLLCDLTNGACSRCVYDSDCPDVYHCASGRCELDSCETGSGYCEGDTLYSCNAAGNGYQSTSCDTGTTCVEGEQANCQDQICTPGAVECNAAATELITCAEDGLSIESSVDCTATDEICYQEQCQDLDCPPLEYYCEGNERRYCLSDGVSSYLVLACGEGTFCDPATAQCTDLLCEPNGPACNGRVATSCNEAGDGYVAGGTDCADTEEYCVNGECRECNGSVLLLGDSDTTGNAAVQTALEDAGMVVTLINSGAATYTGTPAATDFGVVVNSVGALYTSSMAQAGQDSIVAAQDAGTGYLTTEYVSVQTTYYSYNASLAPFTLLDYSTTTSASSFTLTSSGHPIWDGLASPLTTASVTVVAGALINSGVAIATCAGCDVSGSYSGAGVAVREGAGGRIVHLAHNGNISSFYNDENLLTMFVNAVQWAAGCK